ncbi:hypothetical protein VaNZ11_008174, partial [Volvox africanus]
MSACFIGCIHHTIGRRSSCAAAFQGALSTSHSATCLIPSNPALLPSVYLLLSLSLHLHNYTTIAVLSGSASLSTQELQGSRRRGSMASYISSDAVRQKSGRPAALVTSKFSRPVVSDHQPDEVVGALPYNLLPATRTNDVDVTARSHGLKFYHPRGSDLTDCHADDERQWGPSGFKVDMLINAQQAHQKGIRDWAVYHGNAQDESPTTQYTGDLAAEPSDLRCTDGPRKISPANCAAIGLRSPLLGGMSNLTQYTCDDEAEPSSPSQGNLGASFPAGQLPNKCGVVLRKRNLEQDIRGVDVHAWRSPPYSSGDSISEHGSLVDPHEGPASAARSTT